MLAPYHSLVYVIFGGGEKINSVNEMDKIASLYFTSLLTWNLIIIVNAPGNEQK